MLVNSCGDLAIGRICFVCVYLSMNKYSLKFFVSSANTVAFGGDEFQTVLNRD